jgi:hypothetical protein
VGRASAGPAIFIPFDPRADAGDLAAAVIMNPRRAHLPGTGALA